MNTIDLSDTEFSLGFFSCQSVQGFCFVLDDMGYYPLPLAQKILGINLSPELVESVGDFYQFGEYTDCLNDAALFELLMTQPNHLLTSVRLSMYRLGFAQSLLNFVQPAA